MIGARRLKLGLLASLCVLLVALLCALVPAFASATITHEVESFSPLDGSGSGLALKAPGGIAIDEATGNVFVTDGGEGHERVAILGEEGGLPRGLMSPFEIAGLPFGINEEDTLAYDNSPTSSARGTLYVYPPGSETIKKYVLGALSEKYELGGEIPVPSLPGALAAVTLSTDSDGMLYVSELRNPTQAVVPAGVYKFAPSGVVVAEYDLTGPDTAENVLKDPGKVAVDDSGDLFVTEGNDGLYELPANGAGEIEPSVHTQVISASVRGLTIDSATNDLYSTKANGGVVEYDATSHEVIGTFGQETAGTLKEIAFDSATGRIYVADGSTEIGGHDHVEVFGPPVVVPTTGFGAASEVTGTKATLNGSVNAEGIEVKECFFEWGTTTQYGHLAPCNALPPTDSEAHPVSADVAGLSPNGATYHYRLVATNKNGKEKTRDVSFATADVVATEAATGVETTTAILNGTVRPEGLQYTRCAFEYGLTSSSGFEKEANCDPPAAEVPADFLSHAVAVMLSGLQPNATYKFRLTATNASGTLSGETVTFDTHGRPQIGEVRARDADQSSATLEAKINPVGSATSYRFEWGATGTYGHSIPAEFEPYAGEGEKPVLVTAKLSGRRPELLITTGSPLTTSRERPPAPTSRSKPSTRAGFPISAASSWFPRATRGRSGSLAGFRVRSWPTRQQALPVRSCTALPTGFPGQPRPPRSFIAPNVEQAGGTPPSSAHRFSRAMKSPDLPAEPQKPWGFRPVSLVR